MKTLRQFSRLALSAAILCLGSLGCGDDEKYKPIPPSTAALAQKDTYTLDLPPGGSVGEDSVILEAEFQSPEGSAGTVYFEVVPTGRPFTGASSASKAGLANGASARVWITDLAPGSYAWRAWAMDDRGLESAREEFNGTEGADFTVDPTRPTHLAQYRLDGITGLSLGADTSEKGVTLQARVHHVNMGLVRAQFEVKPTAQEFDGTVAATGTWVPADEVSSGTALVPPGDFHWRARTESFGGEPGPWIAFGGNGDSLPADADLRRISPPGDAPPSPPSELAQVHTDLILPVPVGGSTREETIVLRGKVTDPAGSLCALEVEVKPIDEAFDGTGTSTGPFASSGAVAAVAVPIGMGSYHWRARGMSATEAVSDWISFGNNVDGPPAGTDFSRIYGTNSPPSAPTNLRQLQLDGSTIIPYRGVTTGPGMIAEGRVADPDPGNGLALQVEVREENIPFSNQSMAMGPITASGQLTEVEVGGLKPGRVYRWQARTVDSAGAASPWVVFSVQTNPPSTGTGYTGGSGSGSVQGGGCSGSVAASAGAGSAVLWILPVLLLGISWNRRGGRP